MEEKNFPSWVSDLDKSMMEWLNKYCPDFMCVGRKPHPFGNERHTISCAFTSILFRALIVEGNDRSKEFGPKKYSNFGKIVGLMLQMCEIFLVLGKQ